MDKDHLSEKVKDLFRMARHMGDPDFYAGKLLDQFIIIPRGELPECAIDERGEAVCSIENTDEHNVSERHFISALRYLARSEAHAEHAKNLLAKEAKAKADAEAELAADWAVAEQLWDARNEQHPNAAPFPRCSEETRKAYLAMARTARNIYNPTTKEDK